MSTAFSLLPAVDIRCQQQHRLNALFFRSYQSILNNISNSQGKAMIGPAWVGKNLAKLLNNRQNIPLLSTFRWGGNLLSPQMSARRRHKVFFAASTVSRFLFAHQRYLSNNMVQRFFVYQYGIGFFSINMVQGFLRPSTVSRNNQIKPFWRETL